jgi:RNA polymerase sigma-70 factor (ECF subfamily)
MVPPSRRSRGSARLAREGAEFARVSISKRNPILSRVAAGDAAAGVECVQVYGGLVWSLARRFTSSESEAREATLAVFRALWEPAPDWDADYAPEAIFVAMTARRLLLERRPDVSSETARSEPGELRGASGDIADQPVELALELASVRRALEELPPECRRALELAVLSDCTHAQIAQALELPLEVVQSHVRLGLMRVRAETYAADENAGELS